ncbi:hypothetical protein SteCoe_16678 [Stentor coeruleus]|uniref:PA14 domain-containing protein n=1 Tax=Stentor coeruleus TaxID=5963 RepID=A0A1R2C0N9_9CILI|nr:hypothetical protein SteCoe_16678 [Stentor coeruleus]
MSLRPVILYLYFLRFVSGYFLEFYIVSDNSCWIVGPTVTGSNAIIHTTLSSWKTVIPNAYWIWETNDNNSQQGNATVTKHFFIAGTPATGSFSISADGYFTTYLNDKEANCKDTTGNTYSSDSGISCNVLSYLISGLNKLEIDAETKGNHASVMFKLTVTSNF